MLNTAQTFVGYAVAAICACARARVPEVLVGGDEQLVVGAERLHGVDDEQTVHREAQRRVERPARQVGLDLGHLQLGDAAICV